MAIGEDVSGAENYVRTLREKRVVLDEDLARLFNLTVGKLNKLMIKNNGRFPGDFCFLLSESEREGLGFTRRREIYAYTEEGIAMLSTVLDTELARKVSVALVRSAVEMRHFITRNSSMLENVAELELREIRRQKQTDEKIAKIIDFIENQECAGSAQKVFFSGQIYDAYSFLVGLIKKATKSVILVDGYVNVNTLDLLRNRGEGVEVKILTLPSATLTANEIKKFNQEYPGLSVVRTGEFHDRFLILDEKKLYHIGASLKDAGEKSFAVTELNEKEEVGKLLERVRVELRK